MHHFLRFSNKAGKACKQAIGAKSVAIFVLLLLFGFGPLIFGFAIANMLSSPTKFCKEMPIAKRKYFTWPAH